MTIIDCNANLGQWPFRRLPYNTPEGLLERLGRADIDAAFVTRLDAVMLKNCHDANAPLAEQVADHDQLTPIGTVNPTYPRWESDVRECAGELGFRGVRVNPNYQDWQIADGPLEELLAAAAELRLFVELAVRMTDERHHHPLVKVPPTDLAGIVEAAAGHPTVPLLVTNAKNHEAAALAANGPLPDTMYFDMSHFESVGGVQDMAGRLGVEHVVFGTHAPYYYPEAATLKVQKECDFSEGEMAAIMHENAERILAR